MTARRPTSRFHVVFAGGGTGGHIYPNVAVAQRLPRVVSRFAVSNRPGDRAILSELEYSYLATAAQPLPSSRRPWTAWPFARGWRRAVAQIRAELRTHNVRCVVATGGFVSGPAVVAAAQERIPRVLVNLDAIPGRANRAMRHLASHAFTAYASAQLPKAELIGLPLRETSVGSGSPQAARAAWGLDPNRCTLFITGATHGAQSLIEAIVWLVEREAQRLRAWQVLHQCGTYDVAKLQRAYDQSGVQARVVDYCSNMGQAYRAADLAVSRAGAGSVAEAWANGTPTIFLPNPYHRDQHQRHNAEPMVAAQAAAFVHDHIDPAQTAHALRGPLFELIEHAHAREAMAHAARTTRPDDGAQRIADFIEREYLTRPASS